MKGVGKIVAQGGVGGLRVVLGFQLSFINANELFSFAGFLAETVVSDPVEPGRKTRFTAKSAEVLVGAQKGFLGQIVRERNIGPDELAEKTSHARLMISDQLSKGVVVIIEKNASDEVCIRERHLPSLGQRRNFVSTTALQFPDEQVTEANHEWDYAQAPGAAFPIVHRPEEDH
ncbi:MAG: hypothetical protein QOC70_1060 [Verrucomicrobiota bacterium]